MKYLPSFLWTVISMRGLYTWRRNAIQMKENLTAIRQNGKDATAILFVRADQVMDNLRAFAFFNGVTLGLLSFFLLAGASFTTNPTFLRLYNDYTLVVLIGSFFLFMVNGEIYAYVLAKVQGRR